MASIECLLEGAAVVVSEEEGSTCSETNSQRNSLSYEYPLSDHGHNMDDDDDETDDDEIDDELSWRLDPRKSLSDWKVEVVVKGTVHREVYHVHKSVLAVGPRRSQYFASAFFSSTQQQQQQQIQQPQTQYVRDDAEQCDWLTAVGGGGTATNTMDVENASSRLEVHHLAADAFPVLLDYIYSNEGNLAVTTNNATALYSLAAQLEIKALRKRVRDFWSHDLTMHNLCTYYQHARIFHEKRLIGFAEEYCATHIMEVHETVVVEILTTVDPFFFWRVVTLPSIGGGVHTSLRLSLLIAVYCNIHKAELDASMFLRLTASAHLPRLEIKAARALLELEQDICHNPSTVSSLKNRCIAVLSDNWDLACLVKPRDNNRSSNSEQDESWKTDPKQAVSLPRLSGEPLELFTSLSLMNARTRLDQAEGERRKIESRNEELEHRAEQERQELHARNEELQRQLTEARRKQDELTLKLRRLDPASPVEDSMCTKE